jgi:hypothetical protein
MCLGTSSGHMLNQGAFLSIKAYSYYHYEGISKMLYLKELGSFFNVSLVGFFFANLVSERLKLVWNLVPQLTPVPLRSLFLNICRSAFLATFFTVVSSNDPFFYHSLLFFLFKYSFYAHDKVFILQFYRFKICQNGQGTFLNT